MTTSGNINPLKSNIGLTGSSPQESSSNSNSTNSSIGKGLAELEQQRQQLRGNQADTQFNADASDTGKDLANVKSEDLEDAYTVTKAEETNHTNSANNSTEAARRLNSEAVNLKAAARGRDPRIATQLKLQAKEKELKALMEEYNARKEENAAYDSKREASGLQNQAQNMRRAEESNKRQANNANVDVKDINIQSSNVESEIKDAQASGGSPIGQNKGPTSANPQAGGTSPIGQNKGPTSANPSAGGTSPIGQNKPPVGIQGGSPTNNPNTGYGLGNGEWIQFTGNPLVAAARALLRVIMQNTKAPRNINPTNMLSMHATNKTLYDLAISHLDAAQTQSALQGTPIPQEIIFTRTQATTGKGETEVAVQYWTNMQQQNVQAEKDTFKQAERA